MMIRSQDGFRLVPLNRPLVIFQGSIFYCDEIPESDGVRLGTYDSEKRCIEILDEIQKEFQYSNHFSGSGVNSCDCQGWEYGVYQMPPK
jgi:hypothetical protein